MAQRTQPLSRGVVIVGGGHAGAAAAIALRKEGYAKPIQVISNEAHLPYERPPLSKEFLAGEKPLDRLLIRPAHFWSDRAISIDLGREVHSVDSEDRVVSLADGSLIAFDKLIWAAGGTARRLTCPGAQLSGIFSIRSVPDSAAIRERLATARNVAVVGAGFIGLEAAGVFAKLGKKVTVLEAATRVMSRVAGEATSHFFRALHETRDVAIKTAANVVAFHGEAGQVSAVELASGEAVDADLVVVGIGLEPSAPKVDGAPADRLGSRVDGRCRAVQESVYAIGDCAIHESRFAGGAAVRIESVQNANDQAAVAAANIAGRLSHYEAVPWFWSHQHGAKFQSAGLALGADRELTVGDPGSGKFAVAYLRGDQLAAVDSINAPGIFIRSKKLILEQFARDGALIDALS